MVKDWTHSSHYFQLAEISTNRTEALELHYVFAKAGLAGMALFFTIPSLQTNGLRREDFQNQGPNCEVGLSQTGCQADILRKNGGRLA